MKNTLFTLLLIFSITIVSSQEYKPFPTSNAAWKETHWHLIGSGTTETIRINHEISGDTTINEKIYSKICKTGRRIWNGSQYYTSHYNNVYVGLMREDSSKRVYFFGKYETEEQLLYDFNLNVGDTLPYLYNMHPNYDFIVDSIDSVLVMNEYHKCYFIVCSSFWYDDFKLIEGIGSTCGLLQFASYATSDNYLECFKQDGITAYPPGEECELYTPLGINEKPDNKFADLNIQRLTIFTITGEAILEKSELQQNEIIDLSGQESGVYIVKIQTDSDVFMSKLIKE